VITLGRDAHANLIESTEGILAAIDMLYSDNNEQFKAVMTRGICVGAFSYIEDFIQQRWKEVCSKINAHTTHQLHLLKTNKQRQIIKRQLTYTLQQKLSTREQLREETSTLLQLLRSLEGTSEGQQTLLLSENLFRPKGSNINPKELKNSFAVLSCEHEDLFELLGEQLTPPATNNNTKVKPLTSFKELMNLRHAAAHNPNLKNESLLLNKSLDQKMLLFAACFDLIISKLASELSAPRAQGSNTFYELQPDDFSDWRAIQVSSSQSLVKIFDFSLRTAQLQQLTDSNVVSNSISFEEILKRSESPLLTYAKYPLTDGQLSSARSVEFMRDKSIQSIINSMKIRNTLHGNNNDFFCIYFDDNFNIIDWRLEGALQL
jgi:hypothetical protein